MSVEITDGHGNDMSQSQKPAQEHVLNKLAEAWNLFQSIPNKEKHVCDPDAFCKAIHACQNIMYTQLYIKEHGQL